MAKRLTVDVGPHDHVQGNPHAAVTLLEYGDYECPHCVRAYPVVKALQKRFGGQLCFVFRNFPLGEVHPYAQIAAEGAEAAGAQGKFWEMHDRLFQSEDDPDGPVIRRLADELGLDLGRFNHDLDGHVFAAHVQADFMGGVRAGVSGTPAFYINGQRHDDFFDEETLAAAIGRILVAG